MEFSLSQVFGHYLLAIKIAFPLLMMAVIIALAAIENRKAHRDAETFLSNLRFPKSEAERIAEFRQKYVKRVGAR